MCIFRYIISVFLLAGFVSCASIGTKVRVISPETLSSLKSVAIWPIAVVPLTGHIAEKYPELVETAFARDLAFRGFAEGMSRVADSVLSYELKMRGLFSVIDSDSVLAVVSKRNPSFSRFDRVDWQDYGDLIEAESIILTTLSFGREAGGINSYVTLSARERNTGKVIIEVKFNTKWGKSYLLEQSVEKTLPDAIHGAVNGFVNELRKHTAFGGTESAN